MPRFPDLKGTLYSFFQLGIGGAGVRSNSGTIEARNAANSALAPLQGSSLTAVGTGGGSLSFTPNFGGGANSVMELRASTGLVFQDWSVNTTDDYHARLVLNNSTEFRFQGAAGLSYIFDAPLNVNSTFLLNGYKYTYAVGAPSSPNYGDRWMELDAIFGTPKYGWEWRWNGAYWLSPDQYFHADPMGAAASVNRFFAPDSAFNYYFQDLTFTANVSTTNNGSNYWGVSLLRVATSASTTIFTGGNTSANTAGNWVSSGRSPINTHVNVASTSAQAFYLRFATTGSPGALSGGATLIYSYARK